MLATEDGETETDMLHLIQSANQSGARRSTLHQA